MVGWLRAASNEGKEMLFGVDEVDDALKLWESGYGGEKAYSTLAKYRVSKIFLYRQDRRSLMFDDSSIGGAVISEVMTRQRWIQRPIICIGTYELTSLRQWHLKLSQ